MDAEEKAGAAVPAAVWALAAIFFLKAALLALFVTPLFDVPDEVVHFATVSDLASGRGVPRPGKTTLPRELVVLWNPHLVDVPVFNWASIHPPAYHALGVPLLWAARAASADLEWQIRLVRLLSALCGAAGLIVFYRVLRAAGADRPVGLAAAAGVGCVPMYTHMSTGVSHDILCAVLGGLAALFFLRLAASRSRGYALASAISVAAAGAVKATAVPVGIALVPLFAVHLDGRRRDRLATAAALGAVALSTTLLWSAWRGTLSGSDTSAPAGTPRAATPLAAMEVIRDTPLLDHTFKNFFGLIGWTGTGRGEVAWIQVSGAFLAPYLALTALLIALTAAWAWRLDFRTPAPRDPAVVASRAVAALVFAGGFVWLASRPSAPWPKLLLYAALVALLSLSIPLVWKRRLAPESAVFASQFVVLVFTAAYLAQITRNALQTGAFRGTHGRYFFVVVGFLLPALVLPAGELLGRWRARNAALAAAVLLLFVNEALFFALRVIPFYRGLAGTPS